MDADAYNQGLAADRADPDRLAAQAGAAGLAVEAFAELAPQEVFVALFWPRGIPRPPNMRKLGTSKGLQAVARVNHGRWVVDCPAGCGGAQLASRSDRRVLCVDCLHAGTPAEGKWVAVSWPRNAAAIEAELVRRPVAHRNWEPGESVAMLRDEAARARAAQEV